MDALLYLEPALRSTKEHLTPQEEYLLKAWRDRAKRDFSIGCYAGSFADFLVTKRLPRNPRFTLCAGAAVVSGLWLFTRSLESSVDYLLSLQGTRVQGALAQIMLKKHQNDPSVQRRVSKYFYPEIVYNDLSVDRPLYRWRYRNSYGDSVTLQSSMENDAKENDVKENDVRENDVKMTVEETKQVYASADGNTVEKENPFDLVFGVPESAEIDVPQPDAAPTSLSRRQTRREKRTRRRHRHAHHDEESEI